MGDNFSNDDYVLEAAVTRVESLIDELTLDEKLELLHGAPDPEGMATGYIPPIERLDIPPLRLVDGPLGIRAAGESATAFPASIALAASWDPELAREQGAAMGREARSYGQDVLLAPGMNIIRVPHGGRNFEYYSEDPFLSSRLGIGYIEGVQSENVIATAKHYVANNQETNRYEVNVEVAERALREIYLPSFRAAVCEADVGSVMPAYNCVNGTHMSDQRLLLSDVLKEEYDFDGFVVSDWWGTASTVEAANAGLDVEMPGVPFADRQSEEFSDDTNPEDIDFPETLPNMHEGGLFGDPLREAIENGDVDEATIDEKVRRLLRTRERFGHFADGRTDGALDTPEHLRLARRIAIEGTVLLKNDGALPLDDDTSVALIGPNADAAKLGGGGSSEVSPFTQTNPLCGLRERAADLSFERGVPPITESSLFDEFADNEDTADEQDSEANIGDAVAAAEEADCAVVVVQDDATEAMDRDTLELPGEQDELVEAVADAAERTVVVLRTSGPVELPWVEEVDSVVESWYPGQTDGDALAAVLYGDAEPGGRLPVTFGRRAADYPTNTPERFPGVDDTVEYDEGVFVGYRYFDNEGTDPLFPFGHGLSYTTFEYGELTVERDEEQVVLTVLVRNTGERSGAEVVQVYVREEDPSIPRPDRELREFTKCRLGPGECQRASVTLDRDTFAHYDDGWTVSSGTYTLLVGRSSRDIRATATIDME